MKRSEINAALRQLEAMAEKCGFHLPPFCHLTPEQWKSCGHEYDEIRENMLGWDITDYGLGRFDQVGFSLITTGSTRCTPTGRRCSPRTGVPAISATERYRSPSALSSAWR